MIGSTPRRRAGVGGCRRPITAAAVLLVLAASSLVGAGPASGAPERAAVTTGGCRSVGSADAPTGGGPNRATVVVDIGSGLVWSACVSFSGTISGVEALERAKAVITDLEPVYDQYSGLGRAVCQLRGVGSPPPDCLGKSVNYWSLSLNGKVAPVGAGAISLRDGDVEGWRYGTGGTPRAATQGTEAAVAPPPPTTTAPPPATTQPPGASTVPKGGSLTGSTAPDGTPLDPTVTPSGEATSTTEPGATTSITSAGQTTTTTSSSVDGDPKPADDAAAAGAGAAANSSDDGSGGVGSASADDAASDGGSSAPAMVGFVVVIAAVGAGAVFIRRRRIHATPAGSAASSASPA